MATRNPTAQIWNGIAWSNEAPVVPSGSVNTVLSSVSCVSPAFCIAVGSYETGTWPTGPFFTLAEEWDGTGWSVMATVNPSDMQNSLSGVSCASLDFCLAVGVDTDGRTLAEEWDGTSWSLMTTLDPGPDFFGGVSCETQDSSQEFCVAVGADNVSDNVQDTWAEEWDGTSWSLMSTPTPTGNDPRLNGVACVSPSFCLAVGGVIRPSGTIAEEWDGTSWTLQTVPITGGRGVGGLSDVSCVSDTQCTAVGTYGGGRTAGDLSQKPLAEGWGGTGWTQQTMVTPTPHVGLGVQGISCTAAAHVHCTAVGSYGGSGGRLETLAEQYVG